MNACREDLKSAHQHLRKAATALHEQILGHDTVDHLRQSVRSILQSGISRIDEAEQTTPDTGPAGDTQSAGQHLRRAATALQDRVLGPEVASHLRQSVRSLLQAGVSKIDEAEQSHCGPGAEAPAASPATHA